MTDQNPETQKQQEQIYSLSNSLDQITQYLQYNQNEVNKYIVELSSSSQEVRRILFAIAGNLDIFKEDIDQINASVNRSELAESMDSLLNKQNNFSKSISILNKNQLELNSRTLSLKNFAMLIGIGALSTALVSILAFSFLISRAEKNLVENDALLLNQIQKIQKTLEAQ